MATTWACHYRKNLPGYPNPWDECRTEVQSFLICSDPISGKTIDIAWSGYTSGNTTKNQKNFYAGMTGIYELQLTTGNSATPVRSGFVDVNFYLAHSTTAMKPLLATGLVVDMNGYASGKFVVPWMSGDSTVTGTIFALSGTATGLAVVNASVSHFPLPVMTCDIDSATNRTDITIENKCLEFEGFVYLYESSDFGQSYDSVQSGNIGAGATTSSYSVDIGNDYRMYYCSIKPSGGSTQEVGNSDEGGHPPPATGMELRWRYTTSDFSSLSPFLRIAVAPELTGLYDIGSAFDTQYSGGSISSWTTIGYQTTTLEGSGYFFQDIVDLSALGLLWFKTIGRKGDGVGGYWWSTPLTKGPFDLDGLVAYASTSNASGCGVNVTWEGPVFGDGYLVKWSGIGHPEDMGNETIVGTFYYYHDTITQPGREYSYNVCRADGSACSSPVTASGVLQLAKSEFVAEPRNININDLERPTVTFDIYLDWFNVNFDPRAEYISGLRRAIFAPSEYSKSVMLPYNVTNKGGPDAAQLPYNTDNSNTVIYTLALVTGISSPTPIVGPYSSRTLIVGRAPSAPNLTGLESVDNDVVASWEGTANEMPWEYYVLHRDSSAGNITIDVGQELTYTDPSVPEGYSYTYYLETISHQAKFPLFSGLSSFSNKRVMPL